MCVKKLFFGWLVHVVRCILHLKSTSAALHTAGDTGRALLICGDSGFTLVLLFISAHLHIDTAPISRVRQRTGIWLWCIIDVLHQSCSRKNWGCFTCLFWLLYFRVRNFIFHFYMFYIVFWRNLLNMLRLCCQLKYFYCSIYNDILCEASDLPVDIWEIIITV